MKVIGGGGLLPPCPPAAAPLCPIDLQVIPIEMTLKDRKWLIVAVYNPYSYLGH